MPRRVCRLPRLHAGANVSESQPDRPPTAPPPNAWRYASLGTELGAAIIGLTLAGVWADYQFGWTPAGTIVGAGLGVVGGLYNFIRAVLRMNNEKRRDEHDGRDD